LKMLLNVLNSTFNIGIMETAIDFNIASGLFYTTRATTLFLNRPVEGKVTANGSDVS